MLELKKSSALPPTMTSQHHGIMVSPHKMTKNCYVTVVLKYQSNHMLQREYIINLVQKVVQQWQLRSNDHSTYIIPHIISFITPTYFSEEMLEWHAWQLHSRYKANIIILYPNSNVYIMTVWDYITLSVPTCDKKILNIVHLWVWIDND